MANDRLRKLRERVCRANLELNERGLVIFSFGNASGIDRESGTVAIKPSGVDYAELEPGNMVLVDLQGRIREGDLNPSSDTKTHLRLYRAFGEIGGVVHTHSRHATAWAQAKRPLPCLGTTHADYFRGEVPSTEVISDARIARDYEDETGALIVETFKTLDHTRVKAVLVACHGPFTWGKDPEEAVFMSAMLEEIARMNFMSVLLNPELGNIKWTLLDKHYLRKHGKDAYYGQKGKG
jgi:L-ribulose-5-phosphate 4-epimerase